MPRFRRAADERAVRAGATDLGRRRPLRHHVPRAAHRAAEAGIVGAARRARRRACRRACSTASVRCGSCGSSKGSRAATSRSSRRRTTRSSTACRASTSPRCCSTCRPTTCSRDRAEWTPEPAPSSTQLLVDTLRERLTEPAEIVRSIRHAVPRSTTRAGRSTNGSAQSMGTMVNRDAIAPRTSINGRTGRHRRLSVVRVPLADVKRDPTRARRHRERRRARGRRRAACTGCSSTAATTTDGLRLRVMCPVSVRADEQRGALGNKVSAMFVSLPVGQRPEHRTAAPRSPRRPPISRSGSRRSAPTS